MSSVVNRNINGKYHSGHSNIFRRVLRVDLTSRRVTTVVLAGRSRRIITRTLVECTRQLSSFRYRMRSRLEPRSLQMYANGVRSSRNLSTCPTRRRRRRYSWIPTTAVRATSAACIRSEDPFRFRTVRRVPNGSVGRCKIGLPWTGRRLLNLTRIHCCRLATVALKPKETDTIMILFLKKCWISSIFSYRLPDTRETRAKSMWTESRPIRTSKTNSGYVVWMAEATDPDPCLDQLAPLPLYRRVNP